MPAGVYRVHNPGSQPLEFLGLFFDQTAGSPNRSGAVELLPHQGRRGSFGCLLQQSSRRGVRQHLLQQHRHAHVKDGQDVFATHYELAPGASTGWVPHRPAVNIIERRELTVVEARDGKCDESEVYTAARPTTTRRTATWDTTRARTPCGTAVYFNLPHQTPLRAIGNQTDAVDFTQTPPPACPRLR